MNWYRLRKEGLHYLNSLLSEGQWKAIYLLFIYTFMIIASFATIMAITAQGGFLYSTARLPVWQYLMVLSEDVSLPMRDHPEQGIHFSTIILYSVAFLYILTLMKQKGYTRLHGLAFTICLCVGMWLFPFEIVYVPLLDIFHNFPVEGMFSTTLYGLWRNPLQIIANSVIGRNGIMACGILFAHIITVDNFRLHSFWSSFRWVYHFDRKSLVLACSWIGMFALWICLPVFAEGNTTTDTGMLTTYNYVNTLPNWTYTENLPEKYKCFEPVKGTVWFPQTIYVWYGEHPDNPDDPYDIIYEEWHPNHVVRVINIVTKVLTVAFVVYAFTPISKEELIK